MVGGFGGFQKSFESSAPVGVYVGPVRCSAKSFDFLPLCRGQTIQETEGLLDD